MENEVLLHEALKMRAECYLRLEEYEDALTDLERVLVEPPATIRRDPGMEPWEVRFVRMRATALGALKYYSTSYTIEPSVRNPNMFSNGRNSRGSNFS